jgi:glutathione S-transferase
MRPRRGGGKRDDMPRVLVTSLRSPFARKVRIVLLEKGLPFELELVDLTKRDAAFYKRSPLGKVPFFVDEDGTRLFDSSVIVEYLEDIHPSPPMLGEGPIERLRHRELDELGDHVGDQAVLAFQEKGRNDEEGARQAFLRVERALDEIERRLGGGEWPSTFGAGDAAVVSGIDYLLLRHGETLLEPHAALRRWLAATRQRESVKTTAPPRV